MPDLQLNTWYLSISGKHNLVEKLVRETDFSSYQEDQEYFITSDMVKSAVSAEEAREIGNGALKRYFLAYNLIHSELPEIKLTGVVRFREPHLYDKMIFAEAIIRAKTGLMVEVQASKDGIVIPPQPGPELKIYEAATKYGEIEEALRYFDQNDWTFFPLYKVIEVIKDDCGSEDNLINKGIISKNALKKLTKNINRPELSGDMARHARYKGVPPAPKEKMSYDECRNVVATMLRKWIDDKIQPAP